MIRARLAPWLALVALACQAEPPGPHAISPSWSAQAGGDGFQAPTSVAVAGQAVVVGAIFDAGLAVGEHRLQGAGGVDAALIAFGPAGELRWLHGLSGPGDDWVVALAADASGAVFVAGQAGPDASLAGSPVVPATGGALLAKLAADGSVLWSRLGGGNGFQTATAVAVTADGGGIYCAGDFSGELDFGQGPIAAGADGGDAFVARFDAASGELVWLRILSGAGVQHAGELAVGADGAAVLIGDFAGELRIGGGLLPGNPISDVTPFVAELTADGALATAQTTIVPPALDHTDHPLGHEQGTHRLPVSIQDLSVAVDRSGQLLTSVTYGSVFGLSTQDFEAPDVDRLNVTRLTATGTATGRSQLIAPDALLQVGRILTSADEAGPAAHVAASWTGTMEVAGRRLTSDQHRSLLLLDLDRQGALVAPRTFSIADVGLTGQDAALDGDSVVVVATWSDLLVPDQDIFVARFPRKE